MDNYKIIRERDVKARTTGRIQKGRKFQPGVTDSSRQFVMENLEEIGDIVEIVACRQGAGLDTVDIVGTKGTLRPEGFSIGYSGEGPRGLCEVIDQLGLTPSDTDRKRMQNTIFEHIDQSTRCCRVLYRRSP